MDSSERIEQLKQIRRVVTRTVEDVLSGQMPLEEADTIYRGVGLLVDLVELERSIAADLRRLENKS